MSNTDIQVRPFLFEGEQMVRVMDRDGAPWFVAADVCRIIGVQNVTQAVAALDDDERAMFSIGSGDANVVSEGGLYTLILRSRDATKPGTVAHRFRKWVTGEVLPTIRRTGLYAAPGVVPDDDVEPQTPDGLKLRKVNTAIRAFGERAGAQLWAKLGLDWVPAMAHVLRQHDLLDSDQPPLPPGTVTMTATFAPPGPNGVNGGAH